MHNVFTVGIPIHSTEYYTYRRDTSTYDELHDRHVRRVTTVL